MSFIQQVKGCPLFYELHDDEIIKIIEDCFVLDLDAGDDIFRTGDIGNEIYLMLSGGADVIKMDNKIARLKKGDLFGEMVLLKDNIRKADIVANIHSSVLVIDYKNFLNVFKNDTKVFSLIMFNLSRMLADRLHKAGSIIDELKDAA